MNSQLSSIAYNRDGTNVRSARQGSERAFAALFEAYKAKIYTLCLRAVASEAEAEKLTQSIFLQVFRNLNKFREDTSFSIWIYRVTVETVMAHQCKGPAEPLSVEPLLKIAHESVYAPSHRARVAHMRNKMRSALLQFSANHSWVSMWKLGRSRDVAKTMAYVP
jgi:RNA polymerase sigma factor (sigma-70 family)